MSVDTAQAFGLRGTDIAERIAVIRALAGLGDMLAALPTLRSLRAEYSAAHIAMIALDRAAWVDERFPGLIDEWLDFPSWPGIPERQQDTARLERFLAEHGGARHWDVVLQMHGDGRVMNGFAARLGARRTIAYTPATLPARSQETMRWLRLAAPLAPATESQIRFPVLPADRAALAELGLPSGNYAVLHPGASEAARRWAPENFAAVGDRLAAAGLRVLVTGTAAERETTGAVAAAMTAPAIDLAGCTALGAAAALLEGARITVTNDTGVSHLAAAVRAPSVVVFMASDPKRWAPVDRVLHKAVGTGRPEPHQGQPPLAVVAPPPSVDDVLAAVMAHGLAL